jgi:hypothetical protein
MRASPYFQISLFQIRPLRVGVFLISLFLISLFQVRLFRGGVSPAAGCDAARPPGSQLLGDIMR